MKHSGLMLTSLALCFSTASSASDSSFAGDTLHIPHVEYAGALYDVKMKYQAPDKFVLMSADPVRGTPSFAKVKVDDDLEFKLVDVEVAGGPYRADFKFKDDVFVFSGLAVAIQGKMIKGQALSALGYLADGSFSYAYDVSDDGKTIGGRSRDANKKTVPIRFHFDTGEIEALNGQSGGRDEARAVNNNGAIAGYGTLKTDSDKPRIYKAFYNKSEADLVQIGTLGQGIDSRAYGLNNNEVAVGWSASKADNSDHVAFSYDANTAAMTPLGGDILGGQRSFAFDINDSSQIVGVATTANGSALAFLYENGAAKNLGSLDNSGYSEARAVNDKGHTTGWSLTADGKYAAFIHDGANMTRLPDLGGDTKGYDINTHGHVVGDARGTDGSSHAFLFKDGQLIDLMDVIPAGDRENWKELREAYSISDDGVIVGRGRFWTDKANDKSASMAFRVKL